MTVFGLFVAYFIPCLASGSLNTPQDALEQDDICLNSDSAECGMALLQRKASLKKPAGKAIENTFASRHARLENSLARKATTAGATDDDNKEHHVLLADPAYIALLKGVTTYNGSTLYESIVDVSWPPDLLLGEQAAFWTAMYEYDFPNTALFIWGNKTSDKLLVFTPGTNSLCMQYAPTLHHMAKHLGFLVICPQLSNGPTTQESVMKGVLAVEWALAERLLANAGIFKVVTIAGHSGGASAIPSQALQLLSKGINVDAMVLQHAGVVFNQNVPGCESVADTRGNQTYCKEYFPLDLMSKISSVPMLIVAGNFCQWTKVQNSAWLSNYGCCYSCSSNPPWPDGICPSLTFPTPESRPEQPPVTCDTGCPDASFLADPGDCMVETYAGVVGEIYFNDFNGSAVFVNSCGEHDYGTMLKSGLMEEGQPFVAPFLHSVANKMDAGKLLFDDLLATNGTSRTCKAVYSLHDMCLFPISPYSEDLNPVFTAVDGTTQSCADVAPINTATGIALVTAKNI